MSNRIDFFRTARSQLALPAASLSVLLDGSLCPYLEVLEIVRNSWPEFSWARLAVNQAACDAEVSICAGDIEAELSMGRSVCIERFFNAGFPGASACGLRVFVGQIEGIETTVDSGGERIEIKVRDFSANLERVMIYGRRAGNSDGSTVFLSGSDTIFNEDGRANATIKPVEHNGKSCTLFSVDLPNAGLWSYAEAIIYLLCEYLPDGQVRIPGIERLRSLTGDRKVRELDVTGLSLLEALHRCCEKVGLKFKFVPRLVSTGPEQAIVFYRDGCGRVVELNCQPKGQRFSISRTDVSALRSKRNFWPVTGKYIGRGDFKVYEATFELVKAWDCGLEDTDYDKFSPSTNPQFYKLKDVYRKWCLNEAGSYSDAPYNQGEAFDFSKIFEGESFVNRRRRFWPALTTDKNGRSLGYFLQVSFDDGWHWWQYLYAFNNLLDECGIWLSSDQLDVDTWVAALKGVLRFRITASVVGDERLSCSIADGPVGSTIPVVEHVFTLPRQFKYRRVSCQSIFANSTDASLGEADEADDSAELYEFVRQTAQSLPETIETIGIATPYPAFDCEPGDRVTSSPDSPDLLGCRSDNRSARWIERVQMDFAKQCTNLKVVRQRRQQL